MLYKEILLKIEMFIESHSLMLYGFGLTYLSAAWLTHIFLTITTISEFSDPVVTVLCVIISFLFYPQAIAQGMLYWSGMGMWS